MKELDNNDLRNIQGGFSLGAGLLIATGITFLIGVIDGYVRPLKCN